MMQVFNALTQQNENAVWSVDENGELIATFQDGHFLKFPAGTTKPELTELVVAHEEANKGQVVITPAMEAQMAEEKAAAESLADELNSETPTVATTQANETPNPDLNPTL